MSELDETAEPARKVIEETAEHGDEHAPPWVRRLTLTTMVMAVFSAVGALLAGMAVNAALLERTESIMANLDRDRDQIELHVLESQHAVLTALGKDTAELEEALDVEREHVEQHDGDVDEGEENVDRAMDAHELLAFGVTLLSIAITLSGMAVVATNRRVWHVSLAFAAVGTLAVIYGGTQLSA